MNSDFGVILDQCIARIRAGEELEDCLNDYPQQAEALRPLLVLSRELGDLPAPQARPEAVQAGRQKMLAALEAKKQTPAVSFWSLLRYTKRLGAALNLKYALRFALSVLVITFVVGTPILLVASADSLPGDTFYPVKRFSEKVRLVLTLSDQARENLEEQFDQERRQEAEAVLRMERQVLVEFKGRLQAMQNDNWLVEGLWIRVTEETVIQGTPELGAIIKVKAQARSGGRLQSIEIVVQASPTPSPTVTPTPIPTPTEVTGVGPTATRPLIVLPTQTWTPLPPTGVLQPSQTPRPPSPFPSPTPSQTPSPSPTFRPPTEVPSPTLTIGPSLTPTSWPTPTVSATTTPTPTATSTGTLLLPTRTPVTVTATPTASATPTPTAVPATPTFSPTATAVPPTPTMSPTLPVSPTATNTVVPTTPVPTSSSTPTPNHTPTPTPTDVSLTSTVETPASSTNTPTASPTVMVTASATPEPTLTPDRVLDWLARLDVFNSGRVVTIILTGLGR